jgi:hypothetical protein
MRTSREPMWVRVRALLTEKGLNPATSLVAESFPDDRSLEFGIVVTGDGRVFQFDYDYLGKSIGEGTFTDWEDLTDAYERSPHSDIVSAAIRMAREQTDESG